MAKRVYDMKDDITHVLDLPDTYVGSKRVKSVADYVAERTEAGSWVIVNKQVEYPPALLRIFVEILSNAIDNVQRGKESGILCKTIKVSVDKTTGETSVWNDGEYIEIAKNEKYSMYNHTMVFGHLRSSGNYDKTEEKLVSGRNGLGASLTSVFSTQFAVTGVDPGRGLTLTQIWRNNMRDTDGPIVTKCKLKTGSTCVAYTPDFAQFGLAGYTDDIISVYMKYIVDTAMLTGIRVYFNEELIKGCATLTAYSKLYTQGENAKTLAFETANSQVVLSTSDTGRFQAVSFVNGVYTRGGGVHVDAYAEALFRPIVAKINEKAKSKLTIADVRQYFRLFLVTTAPNPEFSSQDKEKLEFPKIKATVDEAVLAKLLNWPVLKSIAEYAKFKGSSALKNAENHSRGYVRIDRLDNAIKAGTNQSHECTLILCEGDSAKTFGIIGMGTGAYGKKGRDYWGVMALLGKILNVRNCTQETIAKNKVIVNMINALGLRQGVDYTVDANWRSLRYGRVMILTDADVDGLAISSLIVNFFHHLFPSLLKRTPSYVVHMFTPIVRIKASAVKAKSDLLFYDESEFRKFAANKTPSWLKQNAQYFKGLGSADNKDAKETFGQKLLEFGMDDRASENLNKIYLKKLADERKKWLEVYDPAAPKEFSADKPGTVFQVPISTFLNQETIKFSFDDCQRSIPHIMDGLKISQRKILYGARKANLAWNKPPMKVAQLGAYVAKETSYHHGEVSLCEAIVKMAQKFPGSNNIPLLDRKGNFGTRLQQNGSDASQPRYIHTRLEELTKLIYREEDDELLNYVNSDGDLVEPAFYVPIVPMVLVNGALGIGTGWSSTIPSFNPINIVEAMNVWLENDGEVYQVDPDTEETVCLLDTLKPWYRGFNGEIARLSETKFETRGIYRKTGSGLVTVSELPIGVSIEKYKTTCEEWQEEKKITKLANYSGPNKPSFTFKDTSDEQSLSTGVDTLELTSLLHTSNMVLFNGSECLKKYTISEIINEFCKTRFDYYVKRKQAIIAKLAKQLVVLESKLEFVNLVVAGHFELRNRTEADIEDDLDSREFPTVEGKYSYLLNMPMRSLTVEQARKLAEDVRAVKDELEKVKTTTEKETWRGELQEFAKAYKAWCERIAKEEAAE